MSDSLNRRRLLQLTAASLTGLGLSGRLFAAPTDGPRFLLVFLRGGYDAANLLVPYTSDFYYEVRPTIAIARPDSAADGGALALDADWALNPAVRDTIGALYRQRQAAFVPFAGTNDLSRSHFETQDSIELGQPLGGARDYSSGFMARLAAALSGSGIPAAPIAFTSDLPLSFRGSTPIPNLSLRNVRPRSFDERQENILTDMYAGRPLEPVIASGLHLSQEVVQTLTAEMQAAGRNAVGTQGFELQAERIAGLMRETYRIGFVDVAGWDTHIGEGGAQGVLATNLATLGRGLSAFSRALAGEWRNTVVVVVSEFGRTFRENGDRGTDHGHGTVYWILGGAVRGGRIVGAQQRVARDTLFQDRDYPVLNNYRDLLGGLFRALWQLSPTRCQQVFPAAKPLELQLI